MKERRQDNVKLVRGHVGGWQASEGGDLDGDEEEEAAGQGRAGPRAEWGKVSREVADTQGKACKTIKCVKLLRTENYLQWWNKGLSSARELKSEQQLLRSLALAKKHK